MLSASNSSPVSHAGSTGPGAFAVDPRSDPAPDPGSSQVRNGSHRDPHEAPKAVPGKKRRLFDRIKIAAQAGWGVDNRPDDHNGNAGLDARPKSPYQPADDSSALANDSPSRTEGDKQPRTSHRNAWGSAREHASGGPASKVLPPYRANKQPTRKQPEGDQTPAQQQPEQPIQQHHEAHQQCNDRGFNHKADHSDLEQELIIAELRKELAMLQHKTAQKQRYIDGVDSFLRNMDLDDQTICDKFQGLFVAVRTWSHRFNRPEPVIPDGESKTIDEIYQDLSGHMDGDMAAIKKIMEEGKERRLFARSVVANFLTELVFRSMGTGDPTKGRGQDYWLDKATRDELRAMEIRLYKEEAQVTRREYNEWRAITASLLAKMQLSRRRGSFDEGLAGIDNENDGLQDCIDEINELLRPWEVSDHSYKDLKDIVWDAIELSQILRCQRPCWSVVRPGAEYMHPRKKVVHDAFGPGAVPTAQHEESPGALDTTSTPRFDPNTMTETEPVSSGASCQVKFFVVPALYRRGDISGKLFEQEDQVILKAEVRTFPANETANNLGPAASPLQENEKALVSENGEPAVHASNCSAPQQHLLEIAADDSQNSFAARHRRLQAEDVVVSQLIGSMAGPLEAPAGLKWDDKSEGAVQVQEGDNGNEKEPSGAGNQKQEVQPERKTAVSISALGPEQTVDQNQSGSIESSGAPENEPTPRRSDSDEAVNIGTTPKTTTLTDNTNPPKGAILRQEAGSSPDAASTDGHHSQTANAPGSTSDLNTMDVSPTQDKASSTTEGPTDKGAALFDEPTMEEAPSGGESLPHQESTPSLVEGEDSAHQSGEKPGVVNTPLSPICKAVGSESEPVTGHSLKYDVPGPYPPSTHDGDAPAVDSVVENVSAPAAAAAAAATGAASREEGAPEQ